MNTIELLGEEETFRNIVERKITEFEDNKIDIIGSYAFNQCSSLTSVSFPLATSIGYEAFKSCSSLASVSIPKATSIERYAFQNCSALKSVSFPLATSIERYVFYKCSALTSISVPKATSIEEYAFDGCSSLTSVSFPVATSIGQSAFNRCSSLTSVELPLATSIKRYAFQSCSSLTSVELPLATSIKEHTFSNSSALTSVKLPLATSIGTGAFQGCSALTTLYIGTKLDTVCTLSDDYAFNGCTNLTNIYVPESLVDSYKSATNWSSFASKIKVDIQPVKCISLSIKADDVIGNATSTTIHYTAECTYTENGILQENTRAFTGKVTSDSFEKNTSTTDTVQRTVSFTFLDKTATTTFTQGGWINKAILVTTEGISDYGWETADWKYNVYGYRGYMSNNKGVNNSNAVMKLECIGHTDLTIYIRSNAEIFNDYTIASNAKNANAANASTYPTDFNSSDTKAHTRDNQNSGTKLSNYTAVTYTGLSGYDIIYIVFTKNRSGQSGDDRGFVLIPK